MIIKTLSFFTGLSFARSGCASWRVCWRPGATLLLAVVVGLVIHRVGVIDGQNKQDQAWIDLIQDAAAQVVVTACPR